MGHQATESVLTAAACEELGQESGKGGVSRQNVNRPLQEVRAASGPSPPPGLAPLQAQGARSRQLLSTKSPASTPCPRGLSRPPSPVSDLSLDVPSVPHPGSRGEAGLEVVMDADLQAGLAPPGLLGEGGKWPGTWWLHQKLCVFTPSCRRSPPRPNLQ